MANILKAGSVIAAGSRIKQVDYNTDTTLSTDMELSNFNVYQSAYSYSQIEAAIKFFTTSIAPTYNASSTYNYEDFVVHDGFLYQCIDEDGATGTWTASKWAIQKIFDNDGYVKLDCGTSTTIV